MLEELQSWWQTITPEMQAGVKNGGVLVTALLAGHFLGRWRLGCCGRGISTPPSACPAPRRPARAPIPASRRRSSRHARPLDGLGVGRRLAGFAVRLDRTGADRGFGPAAAWALTGVLVVILALGNLLAQRLVDFLDGWKAAPDALGHRNGSAASRGSVAGAVAASVYPWSRSSSF